ncbi:1-acyl-sn-glycerol-3-phosphate acyltransferase [Candidatus Woesearchaeota archaeon]|nr:1-acyl-sn-glycerol-3-phosphate acyltransferase [Candidatus Woesearchaeota archaeon]
MVYPISKLLFLPLLRVIIKRVKGVENVPPKTPFIVVANHEHHLDHLLVGYLIISKLNRKVHFISVPLFWFAKTKIYSKWAGTILLFDPKQAYQGAKKVIESGGIVGIFPEGILERKDRKENPKTGAVRLALETRTPILPMGIRFSSKPFSSTINIGKLIHIKNKKNIKKQTLDLLKSTYELRDELS